MELMKKLNSGTPLLTDDIHKISFGLYGHKIYLKARINNSRDANFILDTGAMTVIDDALAHSLHQEKGLELPGFDASRSGFIARHGISIQVGKVRVNDSIPVIADLPEAPDDEPDLAGLIGSDWLRFFCVTIDYQQKEAVISTSPLPLTRPCHTLDLDKTFPFRFPMTKGIMNNDHVVPLDELRLVLENDEIRTVELRLRNRNGSKTVKLNKRNLLGKRMLRLSDPSFFLIPSFPFLP